MSKAFKKKQNFLNPLTNVYSSKELPSYLNIRNKKNIINKNAFLLNSLQNKASFDRLNYNSIKMNDLERYPTQKNLRRLNVNTQKNNNYVFPEDDNIIFAKKRNMYTGKNNNGKMSANANSKNLKNLNINNDMIAKKIQNKYKEGIRKYQKISNYNPKFFSINSNDNSISNNININNNIYLDKNNVNIIKNNVLKRNSNNLIRYNNNKDLNSTMPNQKLKSHNFMPNLSTNNNIMSNANDSNTDKKLSINQNINNVLNDSFKLDSQNLTNRQRNRQYKFSNYRTNTEYKNKNRNLKNDLSWDYGIGILNKGNSGNFYKKINKNYILSNNLSERKRNFDEIESDILNDNDDVDDKEIDEIVDNLEDFFNEDRRNKTVILDNKGFSDDSLSDIADDIVKTFQENENENEFDMDLNFQKNIPSSSNPEVDGTTSSGNDFQNNNIQNQKNMIFENKSAAKPTIINNFIISSSDSLNQNKSLEKDINYNLVIVNKYNNKINSNVNSNLPIPSLVSKTYKSPNILREEKNNININRKLNDIYDNFAESETSEITDNNLMKNQNQNIKQNILIGLNYPNNINSNNIIGSNINNNINNMNNQITPSNYYEGNNTNNNNFSNNFNKTFGMNNNYLFNMNNNSSLKKNPNKNNNDNKIIDSTLKEILSSNKNKPNNIISSNNINSLNKQYQDIDNLDNTDFSFKINPNNNNNNDNNNINFKSNIYNNTITTNNMNANNMISNNPTNNNYFNYNNNNNVVSNNILTKNKKHISFNFYNNIYIKFRTEDLITQSQITTQNGGIYHHKEKDMNLYKTELKMVKPKPIIKTFLSKDIKINHEYTLVENLPERQILPDLYDDFEEDDIKSLEKSLEKSVDKIMH